MSPYTNRSKNFPFISNSMNGGVSFPSSQLCPSHYHGGQWNDHPMENSYVSWNTDSVENFVDEPLNISVQNDQVEPYSGVEASERHAPRTDFQGWADQFIAVDESLDSSWSDLLVNVPDPNAKRLELPSVVSVPQAQIDQHDHDSFVTSPSSATSVKTRMRWTPELHEIFLDAVNKLHGAEKATPKGVLKLMNVKGLTIYNVKSHLQKFRTSRDRSELSEGTPHKKSCKVAETTHLDLKTTIEITEALRLQMEVQKQLHEQLEIQRNLQLRIEEQGKHLQTMFEQQKKMGEGELKTSSSSKASEESSQLRDSKNSSSSSDDKQEPPEHDT